VLNVIILLLSSLSTTKQRIYCGDSSSSA